MKGPLLTSGRHATAYHAPLYLAQAKGFFKEQGLKVALLEPNDPSVGLLWTAVRKETDGAQDVTEIIGSGKVDLGFKAMIHTLAVRSTSALIGFHETHIFRPKPGTSR